MLELVAFSGIDGILRRERSVARRAESCTTVPHEYQSFLIKLLSHSCPL